MRAIDRYLAKFDRFTLRLPKGTKDIIREHNTSTGESINGFILRAIQECLKREG